MIVTSLSFLSYDLIPNDLLDWRGVVCFSDRIPWMGI